MPKLQMGDLDYRIVGDNGEEGELVEYGEPATLETVLGRLVAVLDKEGEDVISLLPDGEWMIRGEKVECEQEDVEFDVAGELVEGEGEGEGEAEVEGADTAVIVDDEDDDDEDDDEDDDLIGSEPDEDEDEEEEVEELRA